MIYVECKPDYALLKCILNLSKKQIIHEFKGKYEICRKLQNQHNLKALIDEEPWGHQPRYIEIVKGAGGEKEITEHGIKVLRDKSLNNYVIMLCPNLEQWIIKATVEAGIDMKRYNLPN